MKKLGLILLASIFLMGAGASSTQAAGFDYGVISAANDQQVLIKKGALENKNYWLCQVATLTCQNLGNNSPDLSKLGFNTPSAKDDPRFASLREKFPEIWNASRLLFSPDGNYLSYYLTSKIDSSKTRRHVLLDLRNPDKTRRLVQSSGNPNWDLLTEENRLFNFAPSSKFLIYLDDRSGFPTLYRVSLPIKSGTKLVAKKLFNKNYSVADFLVWSDKSIFFIANRDNPLVWNLYRYRLASGELTKIASNVSTGDLLYKSGDYLLFPQLKDNRQIIRRYDTVNEKLADFAVDDIARPQPKLLRATLSIAGQSAAIWRTSGVKTGRPLLVWLHGGPYRQIAPNFSVYASYATYDWALEELAHAGVVVVKIDYPGSYGYGRQYADSIVGQVGQVDVKKVLAAVTELKTNYKPSAIYLMGNSYGGYLALKAAAVGGQDFAGAISIAGVTDWQALLDHYKNSIFNTYFDGLAEWDNRLLFTHASFEPAIYLPKMSKVLIFQGDQDKTIPKSQATWLDQQLNAHHKAVALTILSGEDHVLSHSADIVTICRQVASFMNLKNPPTCQW